MYGPTQAAASVLAGVALANKSDFRISALGCGVTAVKLEDALGLVRRHMLQGAELPALPSVDAFQIQQLMGHRSLTTTMRYIHLAAEFKPKAIEVLERPAPFSDPVPARVSDTKFPKRMHSLCAVELGGSIRQSTA